MSRSFVSPRSWIRLSIQSNRSILEQKSVRLAVILEICIIKPFPLFFPRFRACIMGEGALNRGLDMDVDRFIRVDNRWGDKSFLFLIVENNRWRSL